MGHKFSPQGKIPPKLILFPPLKDDRIVVSGSGVKISPPAASKSKELDSHLIPSKPSTSKLGLEKVPYKSSNLQIRTLSEVLRLYGSASAKLHTAVSRWWGGREKETGSLK